MTDEQEPEHWVWPSEAEALGVTEMELASELFGHVQERLDSKPNRKQRRETARRHLGRETRQQLHGFGRWRKHRSR